MAMSVDLGRPLEEFVEKLVTSGRYRSRSEVLREGVRLVQEREAKLAHFRAMIEEGAEAAERGELLEIDEVFDEFLTETPAE